MQQSVAAVTCPLAYSSSTPDHSLSKGARICRLEVSLLKVESVDQMCGVLDGVNPEQDGRRMHRRIVLGTAEELKSIVSARKMVVGLRHEINNNDIRFRRKPITLADLSRHYEQRELADRNSRIAHS